MEKWLEDSMAGETLHPVEVKIGKDTHTAWFRELDDFEFQQFLRAENSENTATRDAARAKFLSKVLCGEGGERMLTIEQCKKLRPVRAGALIAAGIKVQLESAEEGNAP